MRARSIDVKHSISRLLYSTIFTSDHRKLFGKGHLITEEDAAMLQAAGLTNVWVAELEPGEVNEDQAVMQVAGEIGCGSLEIQLAAGGRANLTATEPCCALVDAQLLKEINYVGPVAIATLVNFSYASTGQRVATVKSIPFSVPERQLESMMVQLRERGPVLQARPIRAPKVAVLYCDPVDGERARGLFETVMHQRLDRFGTNARVILSTVEQEGPLTRSLQQLIRSSPSVVLIASTTAPAGPDDTVGRAMVAAGCLIERFLAPVEMGNLLLLAYHGDLPMIASPGCYRSAKPNVLDLLLPPLLARYRIPSWDITCLGHGGLLA